MKDDTSKEGVAIVGHYEVGRTLGRGAFSKVKLVRDTRDGTKWAMKVISRNAIVSQGLVQQLKREVAILRSLNHPNVITLREVMQSSTHIFLVMELVSGGELFDRIVRSKRFPEDTARLYFQQIIFALHYCHSRRVAHRDLKPENILLHDGDIVKLTDFGMSAFVAEGQGSDALLQTTCGTPAYVAPEVINARKYDGMFADLWSCGVVLYVMLVGRLPFDATDMSVLLTLIERADFRIPSFVSEGAAAVIRGLLVAKPENRASLRDVVGMPWFMHNLPHSISEGLDFIGRRMSALENSSSSLPLTVTGPQNVDNSAPRVTGERGGLSQSTQSETPSASFDMAGSRQMTKVVGSAYADSAGGAPGALAISSGGALSEAEQSSGSALVVVDGAGFTARQTHVDIVAQQYTKAWVQESDPLAPLDAVAPAELVEVEEPEVEARGSTTPPTPPGGLDDSVQKGGCEIPAVDLFNVMASLWNFDDNVRHVVLTQRPLEEAVLCAMRVVRSVDGSLVRINSTPPPSAGYGEPSDAEAAVLAVLRGDSTQPSTSVGSILLRVMLKRPSIAGLSIACRTTASPSVVCAEFRLLSGNQAAFAQVVHAVRCAFDE